jgi:NAD+ kinase
MSILLVYKKPRPEAMKLHGETLQQVEDVLFQRGLEFETCFREDLTPEKIEDRTLITIGGDGTVLDASHYLATGSNNVIVGVNSNLESSVGSLCIANVQNFHSIWDKYVSGDLKPVSVMRLELRLDGKKIPSMALNDVLIAHENPAAMTRYWIEFGSSKAFHKNSGLWICSPLGSTGAVCSTGGFVQPVAENKMQWIAREPYFAQLPMPELLHGFSDASAEIRIRSCCNGGRIFIDGPHLSQKFDEGSELVVCAVKDDLKMLVTPEMEKRRQEIGRLRENYARKISR